MKKAIGIIVLVLLWCNVGFAEQILLNCKVNESDLESIAKSERQRFAGKTISLTIDTEKKVIINNNLDNETLLLHGIYGQVELQEAAKIANDASAGFFATTYTYTNEIPLNDEDQTVYKYKGGIKLKMKELDVKIDANRGLVAETLLKGLKFEFRCG